MRAASTAVTFHLVVLAWIFFRAHSITDAGYICQHLFDLSGPGSLETFLRTFGLMSQAKLLRFAILIASVIALMGSDLLQSRIRVATSLDRFPRPIRWGLYLTLTLVIIAFGSTRSTPFIYFQF